MRKLTILLLASTAALSAQFTPDASTRLSYSLPAFTRAGERKVQARSVYIDTFGKKGQPIKRELYVIFDPVTGYFSFGYVGGGGYEETLEGRPMPSDAVRTKAWCTAYVSERGILEVAPTMPRIGIKQSTEKAASLDDAERRALQAVNAHALEAARSFDWPETKFVGLYHPEQRFIDSGFDIPTGGAFPEPVSVLGIAEAPEGWAITFEGQYKVRVIFSQTFEPLRSERLSARKRPLADR